MCLILSRCCILQLPDSKVYDREKNNIFIPHHFLEVNLPFLNILSLFSLFRFWNFYRSIDCILLKSILSKFYSPLYANCIMYDFHIFEFKLTLQRKIQWIFFDFLMHFVE